MTFVMLDRDGVINYDSKAYIKSPSEWIPIPGSFDAISKLTQSGIKVGIASNQSGIARGLYDEAILAQIHQKMMQGVEAAGGRIDKIVYCPHMPDAGCQCRKPQPGMLYEIANFFGSSPEGKFFVGDRKTDVIAAKACGAIPLLIESQMTVEGQADLSGVRRYSSLSEVVDDIIHTAKD
jgi:D-glycero-D-manno-heptose 1,7-bisphosphate phosphatase